MEHGSRKPVARAFACATATAIALTMLPGLPDVAAHADDGAGDARMMAGGGSVGGGPGAIDHVDKPFGQIIRIIPDRGMSALLYLPALPVDPYHSDEETGHPALQALRIDRAWADDPDSWEAWGTFEWDADWQEYAWGLDSIQPVYDDDHADPSILYCTVSYSSEAIDYRDFFLRATAVILEDGVTTAIEFEPALFEYAEEWLPEPVEPDAPVEPDDPGASERPQKPQKEPPTVVNPPAVNSGDSGGNRGGVGQGESERNEASGERPKDDKAEGSSSPAGDDSTAPASISPLPRSEEPSANAGSRSGDGDTQDNAPDDQAGRAGKHAIENKASTSEKAFADSASHRETTVEPAATTPSETGAAAAARVPGFALAIGGTIGAMALAGGIAAFVRARGMR